MPSRIALTFIIAATFFAPAHAGELEGDQLYRVTTVRAAVGSLPDLLDSIAARRTGERPPLVMRHSQGDHWDLMIITAVDQDSALEPGFLAPSFELIAFEEDHYAYGPSWVDVSDEGKESAAIDAGFKERSDIPVYLRSLISGHHDTLAVRVD